MSKRKGDGLDKYIEERERKSPGFKKLVAEAEARRKPAPKTKPCRHPKVARREVGQCGAEWCEACGSVREWALGAHMRAAWGPWRKPGA